MPLSLLIDPSKELFRWGPVPGRLFFMSEFNRTCFTIYPERFGSGWPNTAKRASAIITDTGGLTSHAAIVSRELGVPCLAGTKVATKVLKDGDEVEVDAEAGIVRILG